jgi:hypothetical protein
VFSSADDLGYSYDLEYVAETPRVPTAQGVALDAQTEWRYLTGRT